MKIYVTRVNGLPLRKPLHTGSEEAWTPYILSYADRICYLNALSYECDTTIPGSTLANRWADKSNNEIFRIYAKTVLFYLENANVKVMHVLKKLARRCIFEWGQAYGYADYEKLWGKMDESYGE